jgi:hypothetical protein
MIPNNSKTGTRNSGLNFIIISIPYGIISNSGRVSAWQALVIPESVVPIRRRW